MLYHVTIKPVVSGGWGGGVEQWRRQLWLDGELGETQNSERCVTEEDNSGRWGKLETTSPVRRLSIQPRIERGRWGRWGEWWGWGLGERWGGGWRGRWIRWRCHQYNCSISSTPNKGRPGQRAIADCVAIEALERWRCLVTSPLISLEFHHLWCGRQWLQWRHD